MRDIWADMHDSRVAVFLDLENLLFTERPNDLPRLIDELERLIVQVVRDDLLVARIGSCDRTLARRVAIELDRRLGMRIYPHRGGPQAADRGLARRIAEELPASCSRVLLGTGDGGFALQVLQLRALGMTVEVIARSGSLSRELREAADRVHWLESMRTQEIA
jgi:hypothetical protein